MRLIVNPGSLLVAQGRFKLGQSLVDPDSIEQPKPKAARSARAA